MGLAPSITSRNQLRLVGFNQAKSLIFFSTCFSQDRLFFGVRLLTEPTLGGYTVIDCFVRNPHSCRPFLCATRTFADYFVRNPHSQVLYARRASYLSPCRLLLCFRCLLSTVAKLLEEHTPTSTLLYAYVPTRACGHVPCAMGYGYQGSGAYT